MSAAPRYSITGLVDMMAVVLIFALVWLAIAVGGAVLQLMGWL